MGLYNHSIPVDAKIMVSTNCPIIGEQVAVNFVGLALDDMSLPQGWTGECVHRKERVRRSAFVPDIVTRISNAEDNLNLCRSLVFYETIRRRFGRVSSPLITLKSSRARKYSWRTPQYIQIVSVVYLPSRHFAMPLVDRDYGARR